MINRYKKSFQRLTEIEPKLLRLEASIKSYTLENKSRKDFCANAAWYGCVGYIDAGFRNELERLFSLGTFNNDPMIESWKSYDIAFNYLYYLLPDCKNKCNCG
jgi:hypothetical protein